MLGSFLRGEERNVLRTERGSAAAKQRESSGPLQEAVGNQALLRRGGGAGPLPAPSRPSQSLALQRKCACGGSPETEAGCSECDEKKEETLLRAARPGRVSAVPDIVHQVLRSPGAALDEASRTDFERRFDHDFRAVRLHTDGEAAASARSVNAEAYSWGDHIVFDSDRYAPGSASGKKLLAHELAHVVQHGHLVTLPERISSSGDPLEVAADRTASRIMQGPESPVGAPDGPAAAQAALSRKVVRVNCPASQFGAPNDPRGELENIDQMAVDLATQTAADLAADAETVRDGIPTVLSESLLAYQNNFDLPTPAGKRFLNRLTGQVRPSQEIALSEELSIVSKRFALVARIIGQGISFHCPGDKPLGLVGCSQPADCQKFDAFSCFGNSLIALCSHYWTGHTDTSRAQILIHEVLHIAFANIGTGSILDKTTPGVGRNFNVAGCYESFLGDLTGTREGEPCPNIP